MFGKKMRRIKLLEREIEFVTNENEYLRMRIAELPELLDDVAAMSDSEIWCNAISECRRVLLS